MIEPHYLMDPSDFRLPILAGFVLVAIAWWLLGKVDRYEAFLDDHPSTRTAWVLWQRDHPTRVACPVHKIALIGPRQSCPICGWKAGGPPPDDESPPGDAGPDA